MSGKNDDEWQESSEKKRKKDDGECVIHCSRERGKLVSVTTLDQWNTLWEAAKNLDHFSLLEIAGNLEEGSIPNIKYHNNCRSTFLLKSQRLTTLPGENILKQQVRTL